MNLLLAAILSGSILLNYFLICFAYKLHAAIKDYQTLFHAIVLPNNKDLSQMRSRMEKKQKIDFETVESLIDAQDGDYH